MFERRECQRPDDDFELMLGLPGGRSERRPDAQLRVLRSIAQARETVRWNVQPRRCERTHFDGQFEIVGQDVLQSFRRARLRTELRRAAQLRAVQYRISSGTRFEAQAQEGAQVKPETIVG